MEEAFPNENHVFASNFHSAYLAVPLNNPHGTVSSGLLSMSKYHMSSAERKNIRSQVAQLKNLST